MYPKPIEAFYVGRDFVSIGIRLLFSYYLVLVVDMNIECIYVVRADWSFGAVNKQIIIITIVSKLFQLRTLNETKKMFTFLWILCCSPNNNQWQKMHFKERFCSFFLALVSLPFICSCCCFLLFYQFSLDPPAYDCKPDHRIVSKMKHFHKCSQVINGPLMTLSLFSKNVSYILYLAVIRCLNAFSHFLWLKNCVLVYHSHFIC